MTPLESLMLEAIPVRLPPAPKCTDGPTARWIAAHPDETLGSGPKHLRVVNG